MNKASAQNLQGVRESTDCILKRVDFSTTPGDRENTRKGRPGGPFLIRGAPRTRKARGPFLFRGAPRIRKARGPFLIRGGPPFTEGLGV